MNNKKFYTVAEISNLKWQVLKTFEITKKAYEKYPDDEDLKTLYDDSLKRMQEVTKIIASLEDGSINIINNYTNDKRHINGTTKLYVKKEIN